MPNGLQGLLSASRLPLIEGLELFEGAGYYFGEISPGVVPCAATVSAETNCALYRFSGGELTMTSPGLRLATSLKGLSCDGAGSSKCLPSEP